MFIKQFACSGLVTLIISGLITQPNLSSFFVKATCIILTMPFSLGFCLYISLIAYT
jgi:hypothetical protein